MKAGRTGGSMPAARKKAPDGYRGSLTMLR
jgi:hypothetical protein